MTTPRALFAAGEWRFVTFLAVFFRVFAFMQVPSISECLDRFL